MAEALSERKRRVAIVGAGPVGCTTAQMLHARGWEVTVFEARDCKSPVQGAMLGRSVNLALSARGLASLRSFFSASTLNRIEQMMVPMSGRMIHPVSSAAEPQAYSSQGLCINSISRAEISSILVKALEDEGVAVRWGQKIAQVKVLDTAVKLGDWEGDWIIGCDGAWSRIRDALGRSERLNTAQTYASQIYLEFNIPSSDPPALSMNHLHIWPRHDFMLIALPNADGSFTSTFMGSPDMFKTYQSDEAILNFWKSTFPDAVSLIGESHILDRWRNGYKGGLLSIECSPMHHSDKLLLLGDAAHCMVPFYGQGMNCGLEDVRVLSHFLDLYSASPALQAYERQRAPSVHAMQDLAMRNYKEMSSSVLDPMYLIRKKVDLWMARLFGSNWNSLYEMVTFRSDLAYEEALRRAERQKVYVDCFAIGVAASVAGLAWITWRGRR
ncbi:FAD/NAD(P)-binding domain-containing protein [Atractiella rhizophila]|nr:FAD/NAD(P)-binding domain-containing protein [Atractiella rhizophila]